MILSNLVVKWLEVLLEVGLWIFLIGCFIVGYQAGSGFFGSLFSGVISLLVGGVMSAIIFGFFIVLMHIDRNLDEVLKIARDMPQTND